MEEKKEEKRNPLTGRLLGVVRNPNGRPKGSLSKTKSQKVEDRLRYKHKRHPVDELMTIVDALFVKGKYEEAAEIWTTLLKYMEPSKRPVEVKEEKKSPEGSIKSAEQTFDLLKELEKEHADTGTKGTSSTAGMERGKANLEVNADPKEDLPNC